MAVQSSLKLAASGQLRFGSFDLRSSLSCLKKAKRIPWKQRPARDAGCGYGCDYPGVKISIEQGYFKLTYPKNLACPGNSRGLVSVFSESLILNQAQLSQQQNLSHV